MGAVTVCHADKVKTPVHLINLIRHNSRAAPPANADRQRSPANRSWEDAGPDPWTTIAARIEAAGINLKRVRKDAVRGIHLNLSASPEYFRPGRPEEAGAYDPDRLEPWIEASRHWLLETYGDRLVDCRLHLDEATPHIQAVYVPLTPDGRLSAKEVLDQKSLVRMQDTYAEAVAHLGIDRGARGSKAKHESIGAYYARVERAITTPIELSAEIEPPRPTDAVMPARYQKRQRERIEAAAAPIATAAAEAPRERRRRIEQERRAVEAEARARKADRIRYSHEYRLEELAQEVAEHKKNAGRLQEQVFNHQHAELRREDQTRDELNRLRALNLEILAPYLGYHRDPDNSDQWLSETSRVTFRDGKFYDHGTFKGGGGAIDFVVYKLGISPGRAIAWLREFNSSLAATALRQLEEQSKAPAPRLRYVRREHVEAMWPRVREWLVSVRKLSVGLVDRLRALDWIGADRYGNFLARMFDRNGQDVGSELESTNPQHRFIGLQLKSSRSGAFKIETQPGQHYTDALHYRRVVIVENAVEAMAYFEAHPELSNEPNLIVSVAYKSGIPRNEFVEFSARQYDVNLQTGSQFVVAFGDTAANQKAAETLKRWMQTLPSREDLAPSPPLVEIRKPEDTPVAAPREPEPKPEAPRRAPGFSMGF